MAMTEWAYSSHFLVMFAPCAPALGQEIFSNQLLLYPSHASCFSVSFSSLPRLDNSVFLLPARASCFHCLKFNKEPVPLASHQDCLLHRGGTEWGPEKHYSLQEKLANIRTCRCINRAKFCLFLVAGRQGRLVRFQTLSIQCLLKTICFFLSCGPAVRLCWSLCVQTPRVTASLNSSRQLSIY